MRDVRMVSRPDYASKKRIDKLVIYPDGTQAAANLAMVDSSGAMLYMREGPRNGEIVRFDWCEATDIIADLEADKLELADELQQAREDYAALQSKLTRLQRAFNQLHDRADYMVSSGRFPDGEKASHKAVVAQLRKHTTTNERRK